tara:strand:- start:635 stop:1219 length:585 start_codon:yes stop_codon:yes gene_type:complete
MEIIAHRINSIDKLKNLPKNFGAEIDIRSYQSDLILNHEPYKTGNYLHEFLENYNHKTLVLNIKEAGIENDVLKMVESFSIKSYFLLDVEFPYIFYSFKNNISNIAIRFSEFEDINIANKLVNKFDWIWVDTVNKLPINQHNLDIIKKYKSCLVCPERWNRPEDIINYKKKFKEIGYTPDAVMTNLKYVQSWLN